MASGQNQTAHSNGLAACSFASTKKPIPPAVLKISINFPIAATNDAFPMP
jgi:hypothetical protein